MTGLMRIRSLYSAPMKDLIDGYHRFRENGWPERQKRSEELAERGQKPKTMVLACVDSRVDPAVIFDAGPGELLVVRNVANLVPPYAPDSAYHGTSAALEFGVRVLEVENLVVLGHGLCGGVQALLNGAPDKAQDFVAPWMDIALEAKERSMGVPPEERQRCCEREVIKVSLKNLMSFPWVAERVATGALQLHGAWYAVRTGILDVLQPDGQFRPID